MATIVGCVKARELSLTRKAAIPGSVALMKKSALEAEKLKGTETPSETPEMEMTIAKSIAAMSDVTRAYFAGLEDKVAEAFLKKSAADQLTEAEAAKKVVDEAAAAEKTKAELAEKAKTDSNSRFEKLEAENAELKKSLAASAAERDIERRAEDPGFTGFPGGKEEVVKKLRDIDQMPEAARAGMVDLMKSQAEMAKKLGNLEIGGRSESDIEKSAPATVEVRKAARERAEKAGTTENVELAKMATEPVWAEKVRAAANEKID